LNNNAAGVSGAVVVVNETITRAIIFQFWKTRKNQGVPYFGFLRGADLVKEGKYLPTLSADCNGEEESMTAQSGMGRVPPVDSH